MKLKLLSSIVASLIFAAGSFAQVTSVFLDTTEFEAKTGLVVSSVATTAAPAPLYPLGFAIDTNTSVLPSFGGTINHTGSVTFDVGITVGNFAIGFDLTRVGGFRSGYYVQDTLDLGIVLFDLFSFGPIATVSGDTFQIGPASLLISNELSTALGLHVGGSLVGQLRVDGLIDADGAVIPEPGTVALIFGLAALAFVFVRRRKV